MASDSELLCACTGAARISASKPAMNRYNGGTHDTGLTMLRPILWILTVAMALSFPADVGARVVINEIFYHAPEGIGDDLEFIELHNTDEEEEADISGWAFTKGIQFKFPADTGDSPAPARPMTPEQVGRVRTWSDQGAK